MEDKCPLEVDSHQEVLMAEGWMSFILNLKLLLLALGCGTLTSLVAVPDTYVTTLRKDNNVIPLPKSSIDGVL